MVDHTHADHEIECTRPAVWVAARIDSGTTHSAITAIADARTRLAEEIGVCQITATAAAVQPGIQAGTTDAAIRSAAHASAAERRGGNAPSTNGRIASAASAHEPNAARIHGNPDAPGASMAMPIVTVMAAASGVLPVVPFTNCAKKPSAANAVAMNIQNAMLPIAASGHCRAATIATRSTPPVHGEADVSCCAGPPSSTRSGPTIHSAAMRAD